MTEKALLFICIALLLLCVLLLFLLIKGQKTGGSVGNDKSMDALKEKIDKLGGVADYTGKSIANLGSMTEYRLNDIRKTVSDQLRYVTEENRRSLDEIRRTVDARLAETLDGRLPESYSLIQQRLEAVARGIGEVRTLAASVSDIKKVFSNVKLRGTWGEAQLGSLLAQMLAPNQYAASVKLNPLSDGMVDFAVLLPDREGNAVYLPVDSKFPIEEYRRLIDAGNSGDREAEDRAAKNLARAVKLQADSIAAKYIFPPRTTDFAVMYLPLESLYAEVLKIPGTEEYLASKRVLACGPANFAALLSTLQTGFKVSAIEKRSQELWQLLAAFKREFGKFAEILDKTQKKLQEAQDTIESAAGRTKIIAKKLRGVDLGLPEESDAPDVGEDGNGGGGL